MGFPRAAQKPLVNVWRRTRLCWDTIHERLRQRTAKIRLKSKKLRPRTLSEVGRAQWDRELRVQVRARPSSSSCAVGRAVLVPDQSTLRPLRGWAGRKFSIMGVEFFPSKCSAANWDSCKTQQLVKSALTTLGVVLPTHPVLPSVVWNLRV